MDSFFQAIDDVLCSIEREIRLDQLPVACDRLEKLAGGLGEAVAALGKIAGKTQAYRLENGTSTVLLPMAVYDSGLNQFVPEPISLGSGGTLVYLDFYSTGFRMASGAGDVLVSLGGVPLPVLYAGAQSQYAGLDQLVVGPLPQSLAGRGAVTVSINVDGISANTLTLVFQ